MTAVMANYFKILFNKRKMKVFVWSDAESFGRGHGIHLFCCCRCYLTGLMRLLDISHEHKFPGDYPTTSHIFFFTLQELGFHTLTANQLSACLSWTAIDSLVTNWLYRIMYSNDSERFKQCFSQVIPFKNEMGMELLEKGRVRFWTQVEKCTSACVVENVFNDVIVTHGEVGLKYFVSLHVFKRGSSSRSSVGSQSLFLSPEIHNEL